MTSKVFKYPRKQIGNLLIAIGLVGLVYIFWPFIVAEWEYQWGEPENEVSMGEFTIEIPRIKIKSLIIENVNPFIPQLYKEALKKGVAQSSTSVTPDRRGTTYLFAHSSDSPWNIGRYNTIFYRLNRLKPSDEIMLIYKQKKYKYLVNEIKIVNPSQTSYLNWQEKDTLILQTCTPIGTDLFRLLIFAKRTV